MWSRAKSPNPGSEYNTLWSVSALTFTNAWAVGTSRSTSRPDRTLIMGGRVVQQARRLPDTHPALGREGLVAGREPEPWTFGELSVFGEQRLSG